MSNRMPEILVEYKNAIDNNDKDKILELEITMVFTKIWNYAIEKKIYEKFSDDDFYFYLAITFFRERAIILNPDKSIISEEVLVIDLLRVKECIISGVKKMCKEINKDFKTFREPILIDFFGD